MAKSSVNEKSQAHELIERLAPGQVTAVVGLLEAMLDPVSRAIANAPMDDEPLTASEEKALAEAQEWLKHNSGIPHEQVLADLGITQEEIERITRRGATISQRLQRDNEQSHWTGAGQPKLCFVNVSS